MGGVVNDTRKRIGKLLHCSSKQVVFTPSATIALNIVISGLIQKGLKSIYVSPFEHNAITRVLHHYEKNNQIRVHQLPFTDSFSFELEKARYQFQSVRPDLVIMSHASNVIGFVLPVEKVFSLAKEYDATTLIDMAQTAGLVDIDIGKEIFDFAVFAGHKTLLGPTGISGFVMKSNYQLPTTLFGGTGFESANQDMPESIPERFEIGTQNTVGIAGLNASLQWIEEKGMPALFESESRNRQRLLDILSKYSFIQTVGIFPNQEYVGIVSCLFDEISSDSAGIILNDRGVAVRTGLHCSPTAHKFIGTFPAGTIRFSVSSLTSDDDFVELVEALDSIEEEI